MHKKANNCSPQNKQTGQRPRKRQPLFEQSIARTQIAKDLAPQEKNGPTRASKMNYAPQNKNFSARPTKPGFHPPVKSQPQRISHHEATLSQTKNQAADDLKNKYQFSHLHKHFHYPSNSDDAEPRQPRVPDFNPNGRLGQQTLDFLAFEKQLSHGSTPAARNGSGSKATPKFNRARHFPGLPKP